MSTRTLVTSMFQVRIGMRNICIAGARMAITVVMTFTAVNTPENPVRKRPMSHRSAPTVGV